MAGRLAARGYRLDGDAVRDASNTIVAVEDEAKLYALAGLDFVVPELREGLGEVEDAAGGTLPELLEPADLRGAIHCHTTYSDGSAGVLEMAEAARARLAGAAVDLGAAGPDEVFGAGLATALAPCRDPAGGIAGLR